MYKINNMFLVNDTIISVHSEHNDAARQSLK